MITEEHTKEDLSWAYVQAVAAKAGFNLGGPSRHDYGIDGNFQQVSIRNGKRFPSGFSIDFQLKSSSSQWKKEDSFIQFTLEAKSYNKLVWRAQEGGTPYILIVLCLPNEPEQWLQLDEEQLLLKRCCYWYKFSPEMLETENESSKSIRIPKSQILSVGSLQELMQKARNGGTTQ